MTTNGKDGIARETYASSADMNGTFLFVRRGASIGQQIEVRFDQLGTSAPATWVAYGVTGEPTKAPIPGWSDIVFKLGVKPIGFANSCWRVIVDGVDTGLVLFVGP